MPRTTMGILPEKKSKKPVNKHSLVSNLSEKDQLLLRSAVFANTMLIHIDFFLPAQRQVMKTKFQNMINSLTTFRNMVLGAKVPGMTEDEFKAAEEYHESQSEYYWDVLDAAQHLESDYALKMLDAARKATYPRALYLLVDIFHKAGKKVHVYMPEMLRAILACKKPKTALALLLSFNAGEVTVYDQQSDSGDPILPNGLQESVMREHLDTLKTLRHQVFAFNREAIDAAISLSESVLPKRKNNA